MTFPLCGPGRGAALALNKAHTYRGSEPKIASSPVLKGRAAAAFWSVGQLSKPEPYKPPLWQVSPSIYKGLLFLQNPSGRLAPLYIKVCYFCLVFRQRHLWIGQELGNQPLLTSCPIRAAMENDLVSCYYWLACVPISVLFSCA
jgi:hypothetical protein